MAIFFVAIIACTKTSDNNIICTQSIAPSFVNLKVIEKTTGEDVFFSSAPTLQLKELYFFKIRDNLRKDTIRPEVEGAGQSRYFKLRVDNTKQQDTLIIRIGNNPEAHFRYLIKKSEEVCPTYVVDKLYFKEEEVQSVDGKYTLRN